MWCLAHLFLLFIFGLRWPALQIFSPQRVVFLTRTITTDIMCAYESLSVSQSSLGAMNMKGLCGVELMPKHLTTSVCWTAPFWCWKDSSCPACPWLLKPFPYFYAWQSQMSLSLCSKKDPCLQPLIPANKHQEQEALEEGWENGLWHQWTYRSGACFLFWTYEQSFLEHNNTFPLQEHSKD